MIELAMTGAPRPLLWVACVHEIRWGAGALPPTAVLGSWRASSDGLACAALLEPTRRSTYCTLSTSHRATARWIGNGMTCTEGLLEGCASFLPSSSLFSLLSSYPKSCGLSVPLLAPTLWPVCICLQPRVPCTPEAPDRVLRPGFSFCFFCTSVAESHTPSGIRDDDCFHFEFRAQVS